MVWLEICYNEIIRRILITANFFITYTIMNKLYSGEKLNIHIQSLINMIHENNWVLTTKKG